jgi:hypothetical protein
MLASELTLIWPVCILLAAWIDVHSSLPSSLLLVCDVVHACVSSLGQLCHILGTSSTAGGFASENMFGDEAERCARWPHLFLAGG